MKIQHHIMIGICAIASTSAFAVQPATAQTFHIDVHGGLDRFQADEVKSASLGYGASAGVDFALGSGMIAGIEASADLSGNKECARGVIVANDQACLQSKRDLSAIAKVGIALTPSTQAYALAGYTNARFRLDYKPATGAVVQEQDDAHGIRFGAGIRQYLGTKAFTKFEYRYSNYEAGTERHQLLAGLGLSF